MIDYVVQESDATERLDAIVARATGLTRQQAKAWIAEGKVRLGRRVPRKGDRLEPGAVLHIERPESTGPAPQDDLPLHVLRADPLLLVLDKPAGQHMHPLALGERGTLSNAVLGRFPDVAGASDEDRCPGLLHRLDHDTSGVVLWARTREAYDHLRAQFRARTIRKVYLALVEGFVEGEGTIEVPLAHSGDHVIACPYPADAERHQARPAVSHWRGLAQGPHASLVEIEIPTGVLHQIRAHVSFAGHPVVGDEQYGAQPIDGVPTPSRHLLHAARVTFEHPDGSGECTVRAPMPADLIEALRAEGIAPEAADD